MGSILPGRIIPEVIFSDGTRLHYRCNGLLSLLVVVVILGLGVKMDYVSPNVTNYLQEIAFKLCDLVELFNERIPIFEKFNIVEEINSMLSKRVPLANGGSLVIEQTEALVSIDVNGGHGLFGRETSQEGVNLSPSLLSHARVAVVDDALSKVLDLNCNHVKGLGFGVTRSKLVILSHKEG